MNDAAEQLELGRYFNALENIGRRAFVDGLSMDEAIAKADDAAETLCKRGDIVLALRAGWYRARGIAQAQALVREQAPEGTSKAQRRGLVTVVRQVLSDGWLDRSDARVRIVEASETRLMVTGTRFPDSPLVRRDGVWFVGIRGGLRAYPGGRTITGRAAIAAGWE